MRREDRFRSPLGQRLHSLIFKYIRFSRADDLHEVARFLNSSNPEKRQAILALSSNGYSHLMDILHLPYQIHEKDVNRAHRVCENLLRLFFKNISDSEKSKLLISRAHTGETGLQFALLTANLRILRYFTDELDRCVRAEYLEEDEVKSQILGSDSMGHTSWHAALRTAHSGIVAEFNSLLCFWSISNKEQAETFYNISKMSSLEIAIKSGKQEILEKYLEGLRGLIQNKLISRDHLRQLLFSVNKFGLTPLYAATGVASPEVLALLLSFLEECVRSQYISREDIASALLFVSVDGHTPLQHAVAHKYPDTFRLYISTLKNHESFKIISPKQIAEQLVQVNENGFSPLHILFLKGGYNSVLLYFELLNQYGNGLSDQELSNLIILPTSLGDTPLPLVLSNDDDRMLLLYLGHLQQAVFDQKITSTKLRDMLLRKNKAGSTPIHQAFRTKNFKILKAFITFLKECELQRYISRQDICDMLLEPNAAGFTPMGEALVSADLMYFNEHAELLKYSSSNRHDKERINKLLTRRTNDGSSHMHMVLRNGSVECFEAYIAFLEEYVEAGVISATDVWKLLTTSNRAGFTPMFEAVMTGNFALYQRYCTYLEKYRKATAQSLRPLLMSETKARYTMLQEVLRSKNPEIVAAFINLLEQSLRENILSLDDVKHQIFAKNQYGNTSMHEVLHVGNKEIWYLYRELLKCCDGPELLRLTTDANNKIVTPLHEAAQSGYLLVLTSYLTLIHESANDRKLSDGLISDMANTRNRRIPVIVVVFIPSVVQGQIQLRSIAL